MRNDGVMGDGGRNKKKRESDRHRQDGEVEGERQTDRQKDTERMRHSRREKNR